MQIAFVLFDRLTALDAVGPYEVLSRLPDAEPVFVATEAGPKRTDAGGLCLIAERSLADVPRPAIVVVPGGPGERRARQDPVLLAWLSRVHEHTLWTTSVCTGSLILGEAGLLTGKRATTHWLAMDELAALGARPVAQRWTLDGKIATAAGVSAGIDLALTLAGRIAGPSVGQAIELGLEYDPSPPFGTGSPERAPAATVDRLRNLRRARQAA
jgi:transcriptional regulator GlxA family with amidase domain